MGTKVTGHGGLERGRGKEKVRRGIEKEEGDHADTG